MFYLHALDYIRHIKRHLAENEAREKDGIETEQLKNITFHDSSVYLGKQMGEKFRDLKQEKENDGEDSQLQASDIFSLVIQTFKWDFITCILLFWGNSLLKVAFSVMVLFLFEAVEAEDYRTAYIYGAALSLTWFVLQVLQGNAVVKAYMLGSRVKGGLIMLLFAKVSSLTGFVIRSSKLGRITNLLSNDLGVIEWRLLSALNAFTYPIIAGGATIILTVRLGWPGLVGIGLSLLIIPLTNCISSINADIIKELNRHKDQRVRKTRELIEGIKYIKMYGWEAIFQAQIRRHR